MQSVKDLLGRFTLWVNPHVVVKEAACDVIRSITGVSVDPSHIRYDHSTLFFEESASLRATLALHQTNILALINERVSKYKIVVTTIR